MKRKIFVKGRLVSFMQRNCNDSCISGSGLCLCESECDALFNKVTRILNNLKAIEKVNTGL